MGLPDEAQLQNAWFSSVIFRITSSDAAVANDGGDDSLEALQLVSRRPWFAYVQLNSIPRMDDELDATPPALTAMNEVTDILDKRPRVNACGDIEMDQDPVASFDG